jgi:ketosteroid isomerase-like protein
LIPPSVAALSATSSAVSPSARDDREKIRSSDPEVLVSAFTPDGIYEDVTFGLKKKGSAELRDLHKFFHDSVDGLYVKLIATHVAAGHGTIEWMFGGKDVGVFKTGKPFEVQGVSVIEVRGNRISHNLDYYDAATIMKQVGKLPTS